MNQHTEQDVQAMAISPVALALAHFADDGISTDFYQAWAQMPAIVQQIAEGGGTSDKGNTRFRLMEAMTQARIEGNRGSTVSWEKHASMAYDAVKAMDALTDMQIAFGEPAFQVGLAMGLYLATTPGAVTLPNGGAR
jgi:hypothetical protein